MDKANFLKGNADCVDIEEVVMVFVTTSTYVEVVKRVRMDLKWMDPSDVIELVGRYNSGRGHHSRLKIMPVNSELNWSAYKEMVAESEDRSLELFSTRKIGPRLNIDLNRRAFPISPVRDEYDPTMSQPPPFSQPHVERTNEDTTMGCSSISPVRNDQFEAAQREDDDLEGDDYEGDEAEHGLSENAVGDVEANCREEDMDHDLPYFRSHASDSEDDGPDEEVDEDGLTAIEAEAHKKVVGHRPSLFRDLSLVDKAKVDGGISALLGPRPSSKMDMKPKKVWD